jgi:prolyl 4-hydroxylase
LSEVEKGGATVFPYLNLRILATKGSAAFWYNLHDSGENGLSRQKLFKIFEQFPF